MNPILQTINGIDFGLIAIIFCMFLVILSMVSKIKRLEHQRDDWKSMAIKSATELKEVLRELGEYKIKEGMKKITWKEHEDENDI
ncbi:MAG: hypothetical protein CMI54_03055 [Parcubacteria group bacterium]|nr:hypothetical protein [Parcubacteria group bacterium]